MLQDLPGPDVPWICIDPCNPDLVNYPNYANTTKIQVSKIFPGCLRKKSNKRIGSQPY